MKKVLIIEDDLMIADMLEEVLLDDGFDVCGIARTASEAIALADEHRPHLAIVDMHLADGDLGTDVAEILTSRYNTGILYTTANVDELSDASGQASLRKPFRLRDVKLALDVVTSILDTGKAAPPFPAELIVRQH